MAPARATGTGSPVTRFIPERRDSIEATGLSIEFISDLALKTMYLYGKITPRDIMAVIKLAFAGVLEPVLKRLVDQELVYVGGGFGPLVYDYLLTEKGAVRAREAMARSPYVGPAPVTLADYLRAVQSTSIQSLVAHREDLERALAHLEIEPSLVDVLGPAINSGQSILLFGPSGNGKTVIAEAIMRMLGGEVWLPHAMLVENDVITVYDPAFHRAIEQTDDGDPLRYDARWVESYRPIVSVGGELSMASLDLIWSEDGKYYEAPLQMKANGGAFLIDDFGRQLIAPHDLLNRWIVPLEKRTDFLTLRTGKKVEIPFDQLVLFSTNIEPAALIDEAFARRIRYKVPVNDPTPNQYRRIFARACEEWQIAYTDQAVTYLLEVLYPKFGAPRRAVHPRDLLQHLVAASRFEGRPPQLSPKSLETACRHYFVW